jgi:DNA-directed RNA polymerase specialized sigma24 family protein
MHPDTTDLTLSPHSQASEQLWLDLSSWLFPVVHMWVCCSGIRSWRGQYKEIAEEIVQETAMRTFKYTQRAERGEVPPVISLKSLSKVIALNHFRDRCKKDCRLIHSEEEEFLHERVLSQHEASDPSQIACDQLVSHATLLTAAQVVANFPRRQRLALLTDLANNTDLDAQPTPLEIAFSAVGVQLRDYHRPLPDDQTERGKHSALLCIAYKRLRHTMQVSAFS